jgi:hypothetical protein
MMPATGVFLIMALDVCRLAMAGIFLHAALHAWRDRAAYAAVVENYRLAPRIMSRTAALVLPPAQIAAAVLLLMPGQGLAGPLLGLALLTLFTAAIGINLLRGRKHIDCGCGGAAGQRLSAGLLVRNILLCLLLLPTLACPFTVLPGAALAVAMSGATIFMVLLYLAGSQMLANAQALAE